MIIWINGAFGAGKTTCAYELNRRLKNSYVYDPENIGAFIRKNIPIELYKNDYQDYDQWRKFNYDMLEYLYNNYEGTIIVPMTIINYNYYNELIERLSKNNIDIKHFILYASKETILKRLNKRFEFGNTWGKIKLNDCLTSFDNYIKEEKIYTDNKSIDEIIEEISKKCNLYLNIDKRNSLQKQIDRFLITLKYIR